MAIRTVGVIGTGVIGASWTALFLAHGLRVLVADPASGAEQRLVAYLEIVWSVLREIGLSSGASLENFQFVGASLKDHYAEVDFVQENAPERIDLKTELFHEIDGGLRPDVIIASSSSGIPSSQFISKCAHPGRVLIGHPFNPPHLMPLVEVVPHARIEQANIDRTMEFYRSVGRRPVWIKKEVPGFVANRLQAVLCNEAYSLVSRGIISATDLDACMTASLGPRWAVTGPLMSNAMGGGGGKEGFRHILAHLGPMSRKWIEDANAHTFQWDEESVEHLVESVFEELEGLDVEAMEKQRDRLLVKLLALK